MNIFKQLNDIDVSKKVKEKGGLSYLSWSSAWAEVKKKYPDSTFRIIPQVVDNGGNTRPWHDDGRTGWVEVGVTIGGIEIIEMLAIMDFKNKPLPYDQISSVDANKSIKRCLVKAIAMHGLGLYIYEGEDLPEETSTVIALQNEILDLAKKKCVSDKAKEKVSELCKAAEQEQNPSAQPEDITGNPRNIDNIAILEKLKKQLLAVRK